MTFSLEFLRQCKAGQVKLQRTKPPLAGVDPSMRAPGPAHPLHDCPVVVLTSDMTVSQALGRLVEEEILSAPVWDPVKKDFAATLDMRDIVNLIAKSLKDHDDFEPKRMIQAMSQDEHFTKTPISEVFGFGEGYKFFGVSHDTTVYDVMMEMVNIDDRDHRRALVFSHPTEFTLDNLRSMLSQSAIIGLIAQSKSKLGESVNHILSDIMKVDWEENKNKVVCVPATSSVMEALSLMGEKNISGVGVVDEHGQLMGTLGSRDIKGLVSKGVLDLSRLRLSVREYINYIKMMSVEEKHPAISVRKTDTMATLIGKFSSTHVHRIFVIDEHNMPTGVISTIDLLKILAGKH